ncbi:MAG: hypothetical protein WBV33_08725, partial [Terracidiphilus sp.]
ASDFQRNQRPTATTCAFSRPGDSELVKPSAEIGVWWRKYGFPKSLIRNAHPTGKPGKAFKRENPELRR